MCIIQCLDAIDSPLIGKDRGKVNWPSHWARIHPKKLDGCRRIVNCEWKLLWNDQGMPRPRNNARSTR